MCFSPKVSVPKTDTKPLAVDPAPLTEQPTAVEFGGTGETTSSEVSGRKQLKVEKEDAKPSTTRTQKSVSKKAFGK